MFDPESEEKFVIPGVSEGITNQRMALISYSALAAELNRTLVVDFLKTGNKVMEGVRKLDIGFVFDLDQLQRRLPSGLRVCKAKKVEDLDDDLDDDFDDDELADFSGSNYFSRYLGISPDQIVEIGRYIPEGQDTFVRYQQVKEYAKRIHGDKYAMQAQVLALHDDVWIDLHPLSGSCPSPGPNSCEKGLQFYLNMDRALVFTTNLLGIAMYIRNFIRQSYPNRRITWLHFRVEADWSKANFDGCPFNDANSIISKIEHSVLNLTSPEVLTRCGSVPPTERDILYVAGGLKDSAHLNRLRAIFRDVVTAQNIANVGEFIDRYSFESNALEELNIFAALVDFNVGLLSDTIIACDCSTFSFEVAFLRSMGTGMQPNSVSTFSGMPYPQQLGVMPYMCDPLSGVKDYGFNAWNATGAFLDYIPKYQKSSPVVFPPVLS